MEKSRITVVILGDVYNIGTDILLNAYLTPMLVEWPTVYGKLELLPVNRKDG